MGIPLSISPPSAAEASRYSRDSLLYCIGEMYRPYIAPICVRSVRSSRSKTQSSGREEAERGRAGAAPGAARPLSAFLRCALCEAGRPGSAFA
jgi:hypothetical protein